MAGENNLIPTNLRTKEEQREITRKGGIASGKARRDKRTMRETLAMLLEMQMKDKSGKPATSPITGKPVSIKEAIVTKTISKAVTGDQKAVDTIISLLGEKIVKTEVTGKDGKDLISKMTDEELDAELQRIRKCKDN